MAKKQTPILNLAKTKLEEHFGKDTPLSDLVTARRTFPLTARADLQRALEHLFSTRFVSEPLGIYREYSHGSTRISDLLESQRNPVTIGPLIYDEVDVGD